jgi:hypothetical protein
VNPCPFMDSKESPYDDFQQTSFDFASDTHSSIKVIPNNLALASRPFLHETVGPCTDKPSAFDEVAKVEHEDVLALMTEPMRSMKQCDSSAPPRRFYRTFWRSLTVRLRNLQSIKDTQSEGTASKIEIHAQRCKHHRTCDASDRTLDVACGGI